MLGIKKIIFSMVLSQIEESSAGCRHHVGIMSQFTKFLGMSLILTLTGV